MQPSNPIILPNTSWTTRLPESALGNLVRRTLNFPLKTFKPVFKIDGIRFAPRSITQLVQAYSLFKYDFHVYTKFLFPMHECSTKYIADLGCNAGYFTLLCYKMLRDKHIKGLLVDANDSLVEIARHNLIYNGLSNFWCYTGLVGESIKNNLFKISEAECNSSVYNTKGNCVLVEPINIGNTWIHHFSGKLIDIMKVDIEGSEMNFIQQELTFIKLNVKKLMLDWHGGGYNAKLLHDKLTDANFQLIATTDPNINCGTMYFLNKNLC